MTADPLLDVSELVVEYRGRGLRAPFRAVDSVSLTIPRGRTLGLVGESGCGKSTLGRAILGLAPIASGSIVFDGQDITTLSRRRRRPLSRSLQVVFQDPYTSLNPAMPIGETLREPLGAQGIDASAARVRVRELLDRVGLPSDAADRVPRDFSGGQRQRIAIARALALQPKLIVCDEPVSALDLTTQSKVLDLLLELQRETGLSYLFVSHDLDVVRHVSHEVAVMYGGRIVESGPALEVTSSPRDPYTRRLLLSSPVPDPDEQERRRIARREIAPPPAVVDGPR